MFRFYKCSGGFSCHALRRPEEFLFFRDPADAKGGVGLRILPGKDSGFLSVTIHKRIGIIGAFLRDPGVPLLSGRMLGQNSPGRPLTVTSSGIRPGGTLKGQMGSFT